MLIHLKLNFLRLVNIDADFDLDDEGDAQMAA
jgi:hypothetical protein